MKRVWLIATILTIMTTATICAAAETPTQTVKNRVDQVVKILQDPAMQGPDKAENRTEAIWKVIRPVFDDDKMTRLVMGRRWTTLTDDQKKELIELFGHLLKQSYVTKLSGYADEAISYEGERIDGDKSVVESVITHRDEKIPMVYKLNQVNGVWMLYDVVIDNVSLVTNYRQQFGIVIRKEGYDGLVKRLQDKRNEAK